MHQTKKKVGLDLGESLSCTGQNNPLFDAVVGVLREMGGSVHLDPHGENLVRRRRATEVGECPFVVEVQGWPNLMHEFVHILALGYLEEDSGFNYGWIPLDVTQTLHRKCLWEELSCCVISCNYMSFFPTEQSKAPFDCRDSMTMAKVLQQTQTVIRWFSEQIEILPVFYGLEANPAEFVTLIENCTRTHGRELNEIYDRLQHRVYESIAATGLSTDLLQSLSSFANYYSFESLWEQYRAN